MDRPVLVESRVARRDIRLVPRVREVDAVYRGINVPALAVRLELMPPQDER